MPILKLPCMVEHHGIDSHRTPREKVSNLRTCLISRRRPFVRYIGVKLLQNLKADSPSAALPQLDTPVLSRLLLPNVGLVNRID